MGVQIHFEGGNTRRGLPVAQKDKDSITQKSGVIYGYAKCDTLECDEEYIGELARTFVERLKEHPRALTPIYDHANTTGYCIKVDNFSIEGREPQILQGPS